MKPDEAIGALRRCAGDDPTECGWLSEVADEIAELRHQLEEARELNRYCSEAMTIVLEHFETTGEKADYVVSLQAENERLRGRYDALREAARDLLDSIRDPDKGTLEEYERIAEWFYHKTGFMCPGKDDAIGAHSYEERDAAWKQFFRDIRDRLRAELGEGEGEGMTRAEALEALKAIQALHGDDAWCPICKTAFGCETWRLAGGEDDS